MGGDSSAKAGELGQKDQEKKREKISHGNYLEKRSEPYRFLLRRGEEKPRTRSQKKLSDRE